MKTLSHFNCLKKSKWMKSRDKHYTLKIDFLIEIFYKTYCIYENFCVQTSFQVSVKAILLYENYGTYINISTMMKPSG